MYIIKHSPARGMLLNIWLKEDVVMVKKTETITIRLPIGTREKIRRMAHENYRNNSDEIRKIIDEALESHEKKRD